MNIIKKAVTNVLVKITYKTAVHGAGLASRLGLYQPKVPDRLTK